MEEFSLTELDSLAYELPDEVEKYKQHGDFAAAEEAIERWLRRPVAEALKVRLRLEKRILKGLREDFPYTEEEALTLLADVVPGFCRADLKRLDQEGLAEWIFLDGEKHYIHNLLRNVTQKDSEIRSRMNRKSSGAAYDLGDRGNISHEDLLSPELSEQVEREQLRKEICRMKEEKGSLRRFRLRASIRLKEELFYPGIHLKAHLPIPAELHQTSDVKIFSHSILSHSDARVSIDRADSLYRSICFEDTLEQNREFFVEYEYTVHLVYHDFSQKDYEEALQKKRRAQADAQADASQLPPCAGAEDLTPFLQEQYPHIRFTPYLRALAEEITGGGKYACSGGEYTAYHAGHQAACDEGKDTACDGGKWPAAQLTAADDALAKASAIYDYITMNVKYSYMREYFLLTDIPQYCVRNLRGDCGVQALLFITLCRICGIPAKWQSGLYFAGRKEVGPHDWAMFYAEPYGWLYADPSLGGSACREGDEERRRFYFGNLDPFRMAANNAFAQPFANQKCFLPADPYDNQRGELESDVRGYGSRETVTAVINLIPENQ